MTVEIVVLTICLIEKLSESLKQVWIQLASLITHDRSDDLVSRVKSILQLVSSLVCYWLVGRMGRRR